MENRVDILTSVDVLNTLHGGTAEPKVLLKQNEQSRELHVRVPSIDPESIHVEINNNTLVIYYVVNIQAVGKNLRLPYTIYNRPLPYFIDISNINSTVEGSELIITLPYNALANGYHKIIKTDKE